MGSRPIVPGAPFVTVLPYRFTFRTLDPLFFPEGKAANTLRGALGMALRSTSGPADRETPGSFHGGSYKRLFAPRHRAGPSGLADPPRPFVLRAAALDGANFSPESQFSFDFHLFIAEPTALLPIAQAFQGFLAEGLGPSRGRIELISIDLLNGARQPFVPVFCDGHFRKQSHALLTLPLSPETPDVSEVRVEFVTPTELKHDGALIERPEFFVLMARLRDRISALSTLYGSGPLEIDHIGLVERARNIQLIDASLTWVSSQRRSSRTGQRHPLGGFTGTATYGGQLAEFMPWLTAGYWTGVGRQTVWGKGVIDLL